MTSKSNYHIPPVHKESDIIEHLKGCMDEVKSWELEEINANAERVVAELQAQWSKISGTWKALYQKMPASLNRIMDQSLVGDVVSFGFLVNIFENSQDRKTPYLLKESDIDELFCTILSKYSLSLGKTLVTLSTLYRLLEIHEDPTLLFLSSNVSKEERN